MAFVSSFFLPLALFCAVPHLLTHPSDAFLANASDTTDNETVLFGTAKSLQNADGLDPMVDDLFALLGQEKGENGTTVGGITVEEEDEEELEEELFFQCADYLSAFVPLLLVPPHYFIWDFGCHFRGNLSEESVRHIPTDNANDKSDLFWKMSESCRITEFFVNAIVSQPNCHFFVGFVDSVHQFPISTLITTLDGKTMDGKAAVVRAVCGKELEQFIQEIEKGNEQKKKSGDEQKFLMTLVIAAKTWLPGCSAVFFDARTLDIEQDDMAKLLWKDGLPKLGTSNGNNKWAASKFLCGNGREQFYEELNKMKKRNMANGILITEDGQNDEVRNVLQEKSDEELHCSEQKQVEKGLFQRLWDGLFG